MTDLCAMMEGESFRGVTMRRALVIFLVISMCTAFISACKKAPEHFPSTEFQVKRFKEDNPVR